MTKDEELAHLHAPSPDPKERQIDYWGRRAEKAEAEVERLRKALYEIQVQTSYMDGTGPYRICCLAKSALQ